jgi:ubiquinol-cytochrome c reductase cytochrome c subunit
MSTRRDLRAFLALFALFLVPAALTAALGAGRPAAAEAGPLSLAQARSTLVDAGQALFDEHCSTCHGPSGTGTNDGPPILGKGAADYDFMMSTGRMPLSQPGAQAIRKPPVLTEAEISAITAYLTSLNPSGVPIPHVDPATGSLSDGERIYILNCASCHSTSGNGGAVGPEVAPGLHVATPTQVAEAVRVGPGTMPVFGVRTITEQDLNSLVRYVEYLKAPDSRGGADLGLSGPIIEGFVALLLGLGAMVLVSRYIGERA